jgi:hypothetical protein
VPPWATTQVSFYYKLFAMPLALSTAAVRSCRGEEALRRCATKSGDPEAVSALCLP